MVDDKVLEMIQAHVDEEQPSSPLDHAITFGYLKGLNEDVTQAKYSEITGLNSRTLRKYIKDNRQAHDEALEVGKEHSEPDVDVSKLDARSISEEQMDELLKVMYEKALSGNARDRDLYINFLGLKAEDVINLQKNKATTMRWWIRGNLSKIKDVIDTKDLGIHISESELLYRGDKASLNNPQKFVDKSLKDDAFKLELMYWGMVFVSMYSNVSHPDYNLLSTALRVQHLQDGTAQPLNKRMIKKYQDAKDIQQDKKPVNDTQLHENLLEVFSPDEADKIMQKMKEAKGKVKAPKINEVEVEQRASELQDELEVLLTVQDELQKMLKNL